MARIGTSLKVLALVPVPFILSAATFLLLSPVAPLPPLRVLLYPFGFAVLIVSTVRVHRLARAWTGSRVVAAAATLASVAVVVAGTFALLLVALSAGGD